MNSLIKKQKNKNLEYLRILRNKIRKRLKLPEKGKKKKKMYGDKPIFVTYGVFVHGTLPYICFGLLPLEPIKIHKPL